MIEDTNNGQTHHADEAKEDSISRTKKVLNMVDGYFYNQNSETRGDLRKHLMDEFDKITRLEAELAALKKAGGA